MSNLNSAPSLWRDIMQQRKTRLENSGATRSLEAILPHRHHSEPLEQELLDFVSMASHDLKSPLMVLAGVVSALRENDLAPEEYDDCLDRLARNVLQLQYLAADLTDAVATHSGHLRLKLQTLDLTALARDVVQDYAATCGNHPFSFEGEDSCSIQGDAERLTRLLSNLLSNSVKYSAPEREISIAVWRSESAVYLTVHDRGVGMADADIERLFLPFERLDATRHMAEGNGLGLLSVQKIAQAHGACVEVQGRPRQGTMVKVSFPVSA